jgi:hypothetical protein
LTQGNSLGQGGALEDVWSKERALGPERFGNKLRLLSGPIRAKGFRSLRSDGGRGITCCCIGNSEGITATAPSIEPPRLLEESQ